MTATLVRPTRIDQVARVTDLLERITFQPGYSITVDWESIGNADRVVPVLIKQQVADANRPDTMSVSAIRVYIATSKSNEQILDMIAAALIEQATHEVKEWFRVDGQCHVDPHPVGEQVTVEKPWTIVDITGAGECDRGWLFTD